MAIGTVILLGTVAAYLLLSGPAPVQTRTIERADAVRALAVNGRIRPRQSVDVKPPVSGTVLELPFDVGDEVPAGAVIARIDDGPQRAAIAEATAAIAAQEAVLAQARRDLARYTALGEFVTRRQVEEARLAVEEGERELQQRRASRIEAEEVQQRYVVRAPFGGVILERPVDGGQTVSSETILYRLADLTAPQITAEVDEAYAAELRTGSTALVDVAGRDQPLTSAASTASSAASSRSWCASRASSQAKGLNQNDATLTRASASLAQSARATCASSSLGHLTPAASMRVTSGSPARIRYVVRTGLRQRIAWERTSVETQPTIC